MNEALKEACRVIKQSRRLNKSIVTRLSGILPLIRRLESTQRELTDSRKALQVQLKKIGEPERLDQKFDLFREVAKALEPAMIKKRDLFAKLKEQGMRVPGSLAFFLSRWKKEGLFNTSFGHGWYCLSPKGRNVAGLPPKPLYQEGFNKPDGSLKESDAEKEIASLKKKLQIAESRIAQFEAKSGAVVYKSRDKVSSSSAKVMRPRSLSQLDLVLLGLYKVRPIKLSRSDIGLLLKKEGKLPTSNSLIVLLTHTGSKGMIASSGERGSKEYSLTEKGEARAKHLCEPQSSFEKDGFWYLLTEGELAELHYDILEKVFETNDIYIQRFYKAQNSEGTFVWVWWGLPDQFTIPSQPLLGHLLKYGAFPESFEVSSNSCYFKVDGEDIWFDPSEKPADKIIEFVKQNGKLPEQALV